LNADVFSLCKYLVCEERGKTLVNACHVFMYSKYMMQLRGTAEALN